MHTLLDILTKSAEFLGTHGVENPRLQAEHLIGHALGLKRMQLYLQFERLLTAGELDRIRPLVRRRSNREPLDYILGTTEFGGLRLRVDARALIPRPETDELVEHLSARLAATPPARILDLGTGTGAIALALANAFASATVVAVDRDDDALSLARENVAAHPQLASRVSVRKSDWYAGLDGEAPFDLVASNPPYLTEDEWREAQPEVRDHEPLAALVAPEHGMADLRAIITGAAQRLTPGGWLALETGIDQHAALLAACHAAGLVEAESRSDLAQRPRFVIARRVS